MGGLLHCFWREAVCLVLVIFLVYSICVAQRDSDQPIRAGIIGVIPPMLSNSLDSRLAQTGDLRFRPFPARSAKTAELRSASASVIATSYYSYRSRSALKHENEP
jgi:hypothetical protein